MIPVSLDSKFYVKDIVDGVDTLIFTERYDKNGDFVLKTGEIDLVRNALPCGSLFSVQESKECMIVESHTIEEDEQGVTTLTVEGRTFETFFENRPARSYIGNLAVLNVDLGTKDQGNNWTLTGMNSAELIKYLIDYWATIDRAPGEGWSGIIIPNYRVSIGSVGSLADRKFTVALGNIYERVLELMALDTLGIRNIRPVAEDGLGPLVTQIYNGIDRRDSITLSVRRGHLTKTKYFETIRDYKNVVAAYSFYNWSTYGDGNEHDGLDLRIGVLDKSDIKSKDPHYDITDYELLNPPAKKYLRDHRKRKLFDGSVLPTSDYIYGKHYNLGDLVTLEDQYRRKYGAQATEYIRTMGPDGENAYPTFEAI